MHFEHRFYHALFGHIVNPMSSDCLRAVPRIGRPPLFLALSNGDASADQSRPDRVFGAEKFTGNLLCTEAQNDVFLVEQNWVLVKGIVAKGKKISHLLCGAEKLGIRVRWPIFSRQRKNPPISHANFKIFYFKIFLGFVPGPQAHLPNKVT